MIINPENREIAFDLLDAFMAAGGTAIDTARSYAHGTSEETLGEWLMARKSRDNVRIITKGAHPSEKEPRRVNPEAITADIDRSLQVLAIDTIDLYLLHRDDPAVPVGEIIDCLNEHFTAGKMRGFGASNWTTRRIDEANAYARTHGLQGFVASSPNLALAITNEPMWPGCISVAGDPESLAWYRERQFPLLSWSSQASGFFSGRFSPENIAEVDPQVARVYDRPDNWERLRRAREAAARHGCTPTQVALAWVLRQPIPTFALVGPRTMPELNDCLGALDVQLTDQEVAWLNLDE
jgi:aryl-alcohol dehydrogenase-like predicted oxidoreductase